MPQLLSLAFINLLAFFLSIPSSTNKENEGEAKEYNNNKGIQAACLIGLNNTFPTSYSSGPNAHLSYEAVFHTEVLCIICLTLVPGIHS